MNIMRCKEVGKRADLVDSRLLGEALAGWWTMAGLTASTAKETVHTRRVARTQRFPLNSYSLGICTKILDMQEIDM